MCGFAGFVDFAGCVADPRSTLAAMARTIVHRGPDDEGLEFDAPTRTGLAFRRLSILDLSPAGHQPMRSASGRFQVVFNGEIYNHGELRAGLGAAAPAFRGHSDTETLLARIEAHGVEATLPELRGMFAFAVLDRTERALWLVRDRFGVKPLYVGLTHGAPVGRGSFRVPGGSSLVFASELKALRPVPSMARTVDRGALALFMRHGYVPGPLSIYREVRKVLPGSLVRIDLATRDVEERRWWIARDEFRRGAREPFHGDDREAVDAVDAAVVDAVRSRMVSDVPIGAFLSGGIDSTLVVAAMQELSPRPVKTFTIGFGPKEFDEAPFARAIAKHLGTEHHERYVTGEEALATIPRLSGIWDEPFADSSQIPTLLVSGIAREHVTVSLSGDGGDELFGGYERYRWTRTLAEGSSRLPAPARAAAAALLRLVPRGPANRAGDTLARVLPARLRIARAGDRAHRVADLLARRDAWAIYRDLIAFNQRPELLVPGVEPPRTAVTDPDELCPELALETALMQADVASYLVDDIMVKVDRASMAVSLEAREPLLDHRLANLAMSLPQHLKIRAGVGKWVLREALARRVPRPLFERPKMGFGVPMLEWLRGPLRPWAEDLLAADRIAREGFLDPAEVRRIWTRTLDPGFSGTGYDAWSILMFESWLDRERAGG